MTAPKLTVVDLARILRQAAGQNEGIDLDGDILDRTFEELGYDSLALLETASRIEREHHITLEDSPVTEAATTPRLLLALVNGKLVAPVVS
jgi:act minimal PKS acyl carrier protein